MHPMEKVVIKAFIHIRRTLPVLLYIPVQHNLQANLVTRNCHFVLFSFCIPVALGDVCKVFGVVVYLKVV